jgi:hypothetical protein
MENRLLKAFVLCFAALLVFGPADRILAQTQATQDKPQEQAISQTGLLPVVAVDMDIDPSWVDGDAAPSNSAQFTHNGVSDLLDQAWTTLKLAGFGMIRFPVRLEDPKSPVRLANLCLWAKANNLTLIPVLQGTAAMRKDSSAMSSAMRTLISSAISRLRGGDASALAAYTQIAFYQLERPMNHAGLYPNMAARSAQQLLLAASAALRQAETQALQGTGVQPTPISIGASFDFELIQQGAIAGVPLDPGAEQRAQDSLKQYLNGFTSQNIEAINVEWFPRNFSSGDVDHFVTLLRALKQSYPDKQITLTTGFSSAFNTADQALLFYAVAVSNLGSFRASEGVDSKFLGVVIQQVFKAQALMRQCQQAQPIPASGNGVIGLSN